MTLPEDVRGEGLRDDALRPGESPADGLPAQAVSADHAPTGPDQPQDVPPQLPAPPDQATAGPPAEKLTERPHPLTPVVRGWVVVVAIAIGLGRDLLQQRPDEAGLPPLEWILTGVGGIAGLAVFAGYVSWRFTRFVIDSDELRVDTGAVFRRSTRVAFDKVQAIDVVQPLVARLVGLAELQIDVGSSARVRLRYLKLTRAYALRDYLLARARGHRVEAAEHVHAVSVLADRHDQDEVLVQVAPQTLLLAAVTSHEFFLIFLGGVASAAMMASFGLAWGSLAVVIPVASALLGFVSRRVTGQFNYTLSRREHGLRLSRGLTSLTSQSLPTRRIQAVQLTQSPVWRPLGLYRIDIEVIGWGQVTNDEDTSGISTILLPAGTIGQVRAALAAIWPRSDFESIALHRPPDRARWLHPLAAPFLRWGYDDQLTLTTHGWLVRTWQLVPHARSQSVRITQGPLQRGLRLAELEFHTAGGSINPRARAVDADLAGRAQADLLARVHHLPALDISAAVPAVPAVPSELSESRGAIAPRDSDNSAVEAVEEVEEGQARAAWRADQAEATISSTE